MVCGSGEGCGGEVGQGLQGSGCAVEDGVCLQHHGAAAGQLTLGGVEGGPPGQRSYRRVLGCGVYMLYCNPDGICGGGGGGVETTEVRVDVCCMVRQVLCWVD